MRSFLHLLLRALPAAAAAGLAGGFVLGWSRAEAGFPLLFLDAVRRALIASVVAVALFMAIAALVLWALQKILPKKTPPFLLSILASGAAFAPFAAFWGYHWNRDHAVRPSELLALEPYAVQVNSQLLGACVMVWLPAMLLLHMLRRRESEPSRQPAGAVIALIFGLQVGLFLAWNQSAKDPARPDVLILLVDALRADHVGAYGYERDTTPALDALAEDSVVFEQAIAPSTFTKTSIASLFTGRYPYQHRVYWGSRKIAPNAAGEGGVTADILMPDEITLAESLEERGYLTAAWVQNSHLRRFMGFAQGFLQYHDQQGSIERIHEKFSPWVGRGPGTRHPFFAYLHYIDLHDPYLPPPPYDTMFGPLGDVYEGVDFRRWGNYLADVREGRRELSSDEIEQLKSLYDGQIRRIDDRIAVLLDQLRKDELYDDMLIIVTADHGDAFMEHGFISHSTDPYDEVAEVPLIVKFPKGRFAGERVSDQVRLVDVFPTVLDILGVGLRRKQSEPQLAGCSLLALLEGRERKAGCDQAVIEIAEEGAEPTLALRTAEWKYIHFASPDREDELYDLRVDPGEQNNLIATLPPEEQPLREIALGLAAKRLESAGDDVELDERVIRELKALGYIVE